MERERVIFIQSAKHKIKSVMTTQKMRENMQKWTIPVGAVVFLSLSFHPFCCGMLNVSLGR
jgi:hypothetical protein